MGVPPGLGNRLPRDKTQPLFPRVQFAIQAKYVSAITPEDLGVASLPSCLSLPRGLQS